VTQPRTLTLADFLLARIEEDEKRTRAAGAVAGGDLMLAALPDALFEGLRLAFPARVLAECEAKRQIITRYEYACQQADGHKAWETSDDGWEKIAGALELCCQSLAAVYADHPDYREEWRP
jgi:hypothetical protein